jgi:folate-binding protein YgfZ
VPEGRAELGDLLWLETNAAELNGVSFTKGCYVGQENTARMNWRQKVNRRLVVVPLADRTGAAGARPIPNWAGGRSPAGRGYPADLAPGWMHLLQPIAERLSADFTSDQRIEHQLGRLVARRIPRRPSDLPAPPISASPSAISTSV